jgi:hypothetical protein
MTDVADINPALAMAPKVEVPAPQYTPFRHGLFSVAEIVGFGAPQERNGVWSLLDPYTTPDDPTDNGPDAFTYGNGCDAADDRTKPVPPGSLFVGAEPVTVFAGYKCSPLGITAEERESAARRALTLGEERALENLLATGTTFNGVTWTSPLASETVNASSHLLLAQSFGNLEQAIANDYGGEGTVLVPAALWEYLSSFGLVRVGDGGARTTLGNRVAVCRGFGAVTLDASVDVRVGGPLVLRRGDVETLGDFKASFDQSDNTVTRIVERTYVLSTDFPAAAP